MMRRSAPPVALAVFAVVALLAGAAPSAALPSLRFEVFSHTGIPLADVVWTGKQFLLVRNTETVLTSMDTSGKVGSVFARLPRMVEETRCVNSPGAHGFPPGAVYCHTPDNAIYRLSADGSSIAVLAKLPDTGTSDGALAVDTVGTFGYGLVAATGRSGAATSAGGTVYVVSAAGRVRRIGSYSGPGGADQVAIAPRRFGTAGGYALLTVDAGSTGTLVGMSPGGRTRLIAHFDDGPNPIASLVPSGPPRGAARRGFYVTDTHTQNVFFAAGSQLAPYAGKVLVGSEPHGRFWVVEPAGKRFRTMLLQTNLEDAKYNLEGAKYIA